MCGTQYKLFSTELQKLNRNLRLAQKNLQCYGKNVYLLLTTKNKSVGSWQMVVFFLIIVKFYLMRSATTINLRI